MSESEPYKVRASSWSSLFNCSYMWEGTQLLGIRSVSGPRAQLGSAIHKSTAMFDQARLDGDDLRADDCADALIAKLRDPDDDVAWDDDLSLKQAEKIGLTLHTEYCTEISPHYEFLAVEMETKPMIIDCGGGVHIKLTGTLDRSRVRKGTNGVGISDLKTGAMAVENGAAKTKGHKPQIGTYEMLYAHTFGVVPTEPGEIIGLKTKGSLEIATAYIHGARELMVGTEEYPGLIQIAAEMFRSGIFPPNPSSHLCNPKYCPRWDTCRYHD